MRKVTQVPMPGRMDSRSPRGRPLDKRISVRWPAAALTVAVGCLLLSCQSPPDWAVRTSSLTAPQPRIPSSPPQTAAGAPIRQWLRIQKDGIRDPNSPAIPFLQQPGDALRELPPANEGNQVDWVEALRGGYINPRTNVFPGTKIRVIDLDILMPETGSMPIVRFPHRPHTEWLDCTNCHDRIFKPKAGANPVNMYAILQGEFCGQCHGAVSFPLTQCRRCHSVERKDYEKEKRILEEKRAEQK